MFDTETETGAGQHLKFGAYRYCRDGPDGLSSIEEGLFHADDLAERDPQGMAVLAAYAARVGLRLRSREEFVRKVFYPCAYKRRATVVGLNLPFDLSRLAVHFGEARGSYAGGFSLVLYHYETKDGRRGERRDMPRIAIKTIDSKRALIGFRKPERTKQADSIPDGSSHEQAEEGFGFEGHFLDLRTLSFALTNDAHSLKSACKAFGVKRGKQKTNRHGVITPRYISYCRRDVEATAELYEKLMAEYERHPIELPPTRALSPATIAKAYYDKIGFRRPLERQPNFPPDVLGYAMVAYYGGRTECRLRRTCVPVRYLDFLSMYATVNVLMGTWRYLLAERIVVEDTTDEIRRLVEHTTPEAWFDPANWRLLTTLVLVQPEADILPVRADYHDEPHASGDPSEEWTKSGWQIGSNPLTSETPLWYSLADVIASTILTGRPPKILRALRLVPVGRQQGLDRVKLRGEVEVDPYTSDLFRVAVEERERLKTDRGLRKTERERQRSSLKVTGNSAGYGIFAEILRRELGSRSEPVTVYGLGKPFTTPAPALEEPGPFSFPPLAACITGAARLMLALLEHQVIKRGGTFAFCDTDSMAIVASATGGPVPCRGGQARTTDGREAVRALAWAEVDEIISEFAALNPYDPTLIHSILKVEDVNRDPKTGEERELHCLAISAKRYALFNRNERGEPEMRKVSEHGLGHLLNPLDPDNEERRWIEDAWLSLVRQELDLPPLHLGWPDRPAISRVAATSPNVLRPFAPYNAERAFPEQVKPFNFLLSANIAPFGHPLNVKPERFHLIAPYEADPRKWPDSPWTDLYSGKHYPIAVTGPPSPEWVRVKTYAEVIRRYRVNPEPKSLDSTNQPCNPRSMGLLFRRPVTPATLTYIGKESNRLEDVYDDLVHDLGEILSEYQDPSLDLWQTLGLPALEALRPDITRIAQYAKVDQRTLEKYLAGAFEPRPRKRRSILHALAQLADQKLRSWQIKPPRNELACLAVFLKERRNDETAQSCRVCGTPLRNRRQRYCSERCKKRAYRARHAA